MSAVKVASVAELEALVGTELGPSEWKVVDQTRIDAFAAVTEDHQWIHVDTERAAAGPFGGTIGHGLLTLSLGPAMTEELISFEAFPHTLNYGFGKVRFPAPTPAGSRVRMRLEITSVERVPGGVQLTSTQFFECEGGGKPICVAEALARLVEG
jgi:acyl dehydratase